MYSVGVQYYCQSDSFYIIYLFFIYSDIYFSVIYPFQLMTWGLWEHGSSNLQYWTRKQTPFLHAYAAHTNIFDWQINRFVFHKFDHVDGWAVREHAIAASDKLNEVIGARVKHVIDPPSTPVSLYLSFSKVKCRRTTFP